MIVRLIRWHCPRNSTPVGLRPSPLPLGHGGSSNYWIFTSERGRNILYLWKRPERGTDPQSPTFQASSFNHCSRAPPRPRGESVAYSTSGQEWRQCVTDWCEVKVKIMTSASQLSLYIMRGNDTRGGDSMIWHKLTSGRHHNILHGVNPFSPGTVFRRQNLTSTDVRFWRIKTIPALKELKYV